MFVHSVIYFTTILFSWCSVIAFLSLPHKIAPDDQDDFEKEMASELSMTVQHLAASFAKKKPQHSGSSSTPLATKEEEKTEGGDAEYYDDVYFDSDDSDSEGTAHCILICLVYNWTTLMGITAFVNWIV